jgi:predicted TIM-barrel fold metal-dependent hydrolase
MDIVYQTFILLSRRITMLSKQKFDTFIRIYDDVGYITSKSDFGDRVVDASGAVFLAALDRRDTRFSYAHAPLPLAPYLWYIPAYLDQGVTVETAMASLPYCGIKLHPLAHRWDFAHSRHADALHHLFGYAGQHGLPVLIHPGEAYHWLLTMKPSIPPSDSTSGK